MSKISVLFLGSGEFSVEVFKILDNSGLFNVLQVFSLPDRPVGRKAKLTPTPFKFEAISRGYKVFLAENSNEILSLVDCEPDFVIVVDYGVMLSDKVLKLAKIDTLNVHASLLPKYRGASPIQAALLNNDRVTGVTVMKVEKRLDAGPIYALGEYEINDSDNYNSLLHALGDLGGNLLVEVLPYIFSGKCIPIDQIEEFASYCTKIEKKDGMITFTDMSAQEIFNKFRAFADWPKIFFVHNDKKFQIVEMKISDKTFSSIFTVQDNTLYVKTADGVIAITRIKPESKNEMSIVDFLRGSPGFFD